MRTLILVLWSLLASVLLSGQEAKPKLAFDEFFNSVSFSGLKLSPDGNSVVFDIEKADWDQEMYRSELWLYRINSGSLIQLTQSGRDSSPVWSPDGQWIAFLSERKVAGGKDGDAADEKSKEISQLFLISPNGGEAFAVTSGDDEVHSFGWAADSKSLYFATREPWTKDQNDAHKKDWKDVVRFRSDERGDVIFRIMLDEALARHNALGTKERPEAEKDTGATPGASVVAHTPWRVEQLAVARNGMRLAFMGTSVSERNEKVEEYEIYLVNLATRAAEATPSRLTRNEAVEVNLEWAPDNLHLFFQTSLGSVEGKYEDNQPRLYWIDTGSGEVQRWFGDYKGEVARYTPMPDGSVVCACREGTEIQLYSQARPKAPMVKHPGWPGHYEIPASALQSQRIAFLYSAIEKPTEVYIADGPDKLMQARPITSFNKLFTERDLPKAKPYRWTSDDGTSIEGMLMYPPGKFEAKNLPVFVFIHGGPQDADGNHFEADWYQWDRLAATAGWLVFEPNYRGSTGYGDKFALQIVPEIVSKPGRDILAGVDALVKDGIADADHLAIGGYSYGGYMTNWLITQTTRFKAAVTGAGAVEHIADWGNDDTGFDDVYFLGGHAWEVPDRYRSEAAIFQINKVRTPTHMVGGADDIRVAVLEDYLLDRALHELNVPSELLIFPGEGHSLSKNPWHGKIKVREELKWLSKYGGVGGTN
jgi:dipeptidyl aminopeptidase/acylaminoacyl peptidase